jgi:autotransporter-associated beta strand protein
MSRFISCIIAALVLPSIAGGQTAVDPDPNGVLLTPIPDKLIVLTFDDSTASHATVVAPILKQLGFGGTFYVCDFDSFRTRKDWYLTYRQMIAMDAAGFEIGNHTLGHASGYGPVIAMEDQVLAHGGPLMTTLCWPIYAVNWADCPKLADHGYTFGRGGHGRPYRPTVDNPFDVPSFSIHDGVPIETFTTQARQACNGRIVCFCFHGVPDMEHPPVSLEPATFKAMMQYLKDNDYRCIAMRDVAKYIDPVKAATLPRTTDDIKGAPPFLTLQDDKPFVAAPENVIKEFVVPGLRPATISRTNVTLAVDHGTDVTALAPTIKVSDGASITPASGVSRDFSKAQEYVVTARDGNPRRYLVAVKAAPVSKAAAIVEFTVPGAIATAVSGSCIVVTVPKAMNVTSLAPTFALSPFATALPASGTTRDFSTPQRYTVTAQDKSTRTVMVAVAGSDNPTAFTWNKAGDGTWSDAARWSGGAAPELSGQSDYVLHFDQGGPGKVQNDLHEKFLLNQLVLDDRSGGLTLGGNSMTFVRGFGSSIAPAIRMGRCGRVDIDVAVSLQDDLAVMTARGRDPNGFVSFNGVISGPHSLILDSTGDPDVAGINFHDVHYGILQLNKSNTYSGGTRISGGKINVRKADGLGTGVVTLDNFGSLSAEKALANALVVNDGILFNCSTSGPITLNGTAHCISRCTLSGAIAGPGGLIMHGTNGTYLNMVPGGILALDGTNSYRGPTIVFPGTLKVSKAAGLYGGVPAQWTAKNITIHRAATLRLNVGGPGELSGEQLGSLLTGLTASVDENGLMGGSCLAVDTANATAPVVVSATIADSNGPGGGSFLVKKCGAGVMKLAGDNTYTGRTVLEGGALSVSSFNNCSPGKTRAASSLGVPGDIEAGEIVIGEEGKDGECAVIYTGQGEITDRVMNVAGKNATVTFEHAGAGVLKFTSDILISGYGAGKTITLAGDTAGTGEIAGAIRDPHDREGKARTSVRKTGRGTWTLSGINTFRGPTRITQGVLSLAHAECLSATAEIEISDGAKLDLNFRGEMRVGKLIHDGKELEPGRYDAENSPRFITGTGVLKL